MSGWRKLLLSVQSMLTTWSPLEGAVVAGALVAGALVAGAAVAGAIVGAVVPAVSVGATGGRGVLVGVSVPQALNSSVNPSMYVDKRCHLALDGSVFGPPLGFAFL